MDENIDKERIFFSRDSLIGRFDIFEKCHACLFCELLALNRTQSAIKRALD
jgi:hypothetical protein